MVMQINWLSQEITQICGSEARLKQLQVKATILSADEDALSLTEKTELFMTLPSIIRSLRIVLQERKLENMR